LPVNVMVDRAFPSLSRATNVNSPSCVPDLSISATSKDASVTPSVLSIATEVAVPGSDVRKKVPSAPASSGVSFGKNPSAGAPILTMLSPLGLEKMTPKADSHSSPKMRVVSLENPVSKSRSDAARDIPDERVSARIAADILNSVIRPACAARRRDGPTGTLSQGLGGNRRRTQSVA